VPSYESVFRTLSLRVELDHPLSGRPEADAQRLVDALRHGRAFTVVDAFARPGAMEFFGEVTSETSHGLVRMGDAVPPGTRSLRLHVRTASPAGAVVSLLANGVRVAQGTGVELAYDATGRDLAGPTMFRVEVEMPPRGRRRLAPWILSNGIFAGAVEVPAPGASPGDAHAGEAGRAVRDLLSAGSGTAWTIERDPGSRGTFDRTDPGGRIAFSFALGSDNKNAWSALVAGLGRPVGGGAVFRLRARASRPLRLSVQVRASAVNADLRWRRSVYVDETARTVDVPVDQMAPVGRSVPQGERPRAGELLFVVDRVNATPGSAGTVWIEGLEQRGGEAAPHVRTVNSR